MEATSVSKTHFLAGKAVVVAGGGMAGLSFAISLRRLWKDEYGEFPHVSIYERETKEPGVGREGYSMSIRSDGMSGGMQALRRMGLLDAALDVSITGTQEERGSFNVWNVNWKPMLRVNPSTPDNLPVPGMRIARYKLRSTLVQAASQDFTITWGTACAKASGLLNGRIKIQLDNGKEEECDLLVAADGSNSKLRASLKPEDTLSFAGAVCISAVSRFGGSPPSPVTMDWGIVTSGSGRAVFASPVDSTSAVWNLSYITKDPRPPKRPPIASNEVTALLDEAKQLGSEFKEPFNQLVDATDTKSLMVFNAMDKMPFGHGSENGLPSNVVFIGDSNHAVSPFAGNGANLAMMDGWDLAECLCDRTSLEMALKDYDTRSISRAKTTIKMSRTVIAMSHAIGWRWWLYSSLLSVVGWWLSFGSKK